jgi:RNA polymerase sigma factor (sigma-70 family)
MNYDEIELCVMRAKAGSGSDTVKLLNQYKPFIIKTAKQFSLKNHDQLDLLQIGYASIIKAISKYNLGSNTFSSYAYNTIKNTLNQTARDCSKLSGELSINSPIKSDGSNPSEFIDCISSDEDTEETILNNLQASALRNIVAKLPKEEQELVHMLYYNKGSLRSYAIERNMNYLQAIRKRDRILRKLRSGLERKI